MLSSTSNSDDRLPSINFLWLWVATIPVTLALLTVSEVWWRTRGHTTDLSDTKELWCLHRAKATPRNQQKVLAVVGWSRAQQGIVPTLLQAAFPEYQIVHLPINGTPSYAVFADLCHDSAFHGIILFETTAAGLMMDPEKEERAIDYVEYYRRNFSAPQGTDENCNAWIGATLQAHLVVFSPALSPRNLLRTAFAPFPRFISMDEYRYRAAHYRTRLSISEIETQRELRLSRVRPFAEIRLSQQDFQRHLREFVRRDYNSLRNRGGRAVFIRMPTTGDHWRIDSAIAPKQLFWDRITSSTGVPTIHFRDYPGLSEFECPDGSHLDALDAPPFTLRLAAIVQRMLAADMPRPDGPTLIGRVIESE